MISFQTPILLITFNRLSTTKLVFAEIKHQKPKQLFIASDGPRDNKPGEAEDVNMVRDYLLSQIDWDCEVKTLFRDANLGCGVAPYQAITWFFDHVEQGIILEDDCLPLPGFFQFCEEMLNHYKHDERMYEVTGNNFQGGNVRGDGSYYFSNYGGIWGWATWARAWKKFDYYMDGFDVFLQDKTLEKTLKNPDQYRFWIKILINAKKLGSWWDYQWLYTFWRNKGICIVPNKNLIRNIGFDEGGTHTFSKPKWYDKLIAGTNDLPEPLQHPSTVVVSSSADDFLFKNTMQVTFFNRLISFIKRKLSNK